MNPYQTKLVQTAKNDIRSAELSLSESLYAQTISRAYYAMFHLAQAILEEKQLGFSKHSAVISAFGREYAKSGLIDPLFHGYLIDAEEDRLKADYDVMAVLNPEIASLNLDRARAFLEMTITYLKK